MDGDWVRIRDCVLVTYGASFSLQDHGKTIKHFTLKSMKLKISLIYMHRVAATLPFTV
jgi:hypothetical protein